MELKQYKNTNIWSDILGNIYLYKNGNYIKKNPQNKKGDYLSIRIKEFNRSVRVHRIISETWIQNKFNKPQVNHINGLKQDNRVENLEWVTCKENIRHAIKNNLIDKNRISNLMKKRAKTVLMLSLENKHILWFDSISEASEMSNICERRIYGCCNKEKYRKTAGGYKWRWLKDGDL